jgi:hypothetical protein
VADCDKTLQLQLMFVGGSTDEFIRHVMNLSGQHSIDFICCDDVYSAVGELAKSERPNVLVAGRIRQLSKEQGRFFHIVREKGYRCCCLADGDANRQREFVLAANETGAFIINEPVEIEDVVRKLLSGNGECAPGKKGGRRRTHFFKDEFLTTRAELDALLEVQLDEKP